MPLTRQTSSESISGAGFGTEPRAISSLDFGASLPYLERFGGLREAVVIGVSCGFSARYVATFLDAAMDDARRRFHAVALGFNPIRHASVTAFKDCLRRMRREDLSPIARGARRIVVNPRVGPEAVAGSSRLKGGAATKSILVVTSIW